MSTTTRSRRIFVVANPFGKVSTNRPEASPAPFDVAVQSGKTYWWRACGLSKQQPFSVMVTCLPIGGPVIPRAMADLIGPLKSAGGSMPRGGP
jgi:hypothetical protein